MAGHQERGTYDHPTRGERMPGGVGAAFPAGHADRRAPLSRQHGTGQRCLMMRHRTASPGGAPGLPAGLRRGASGRRTSGLEPQGGHGAGSRPMTSCLPLHHPLWATCGWGGGVVNRSRQRRRGCALGRLARKPEGRRRGSRGATHGRGSGGYMRQRSAPWSGPACLDDGDGRQNGPSRPARRGAGGAPWPRDG